MLHIVTDSTCDLRPAEAQSLGVTVVPLTVRFGDEQFRDGIDIDGDTFYRRLESASALPTTSQPSPEQFAEVYRDLLRDPDDRVLSIHIAQKWSGTLQSATVAAQDFDGRVAAVDSGTVSVGMQFLIRAAIADRAGGADADTVVRNTQARRDRVMIYVLLDTLTYLHKGGRIGPAQAFLGGILNVKPLLRVVDGEAHPQARTRNRQQGVEKLLELVPAGTRLQGLGTMHTSAPELLDEVRRRLGDAQPGTELIAGQIGPVVGTYVGPRAIGVAWLLAD
ncbi:MAG: DegV family protein [Chloroflexi bacterium]|nr:MAG: DegV family protein [Chloroflexota bacterium]